MQVLPPGLRSQEGPPAEARSREADWCSNDDPLLHAVQYVRRVHVQVRGRERMMCPLYLGWPSSRCPPDQTRTAVSNSAWRTRLQTYLQWAMRSRNLAFQQSDSSDWWLNFCNGTPFFADVPLYARYIACSSSGCSRVGTAMCVLCWAERRAVATTRWPIAADALHDPCNTRSDWHGGSRSKQMAVVYIPHLTPLSECIACSINQSINLWGRPGRFDDAVSVHLHLVNLAFLLGTPFIQASGRPTAVVRCTPTTLEHTKSCFRVTQSCVPDRGLLSYPFLLAGFV